MFIFWKKDPQVTQRNDATLKSKTSTLGRIGEDLACEYLARKSYKIIERNYRKPWGEIDIICRAPDRTLVFVEVKTLRSYSGQAQEGLMPEDELTKAKLGKLQKTASLYTGHYPERVSEKGWRIDLVAITINDDYNDDKTNPKVEHYENI